MGDGSHPGDVLLLPLPLAEAALWMSDAQLAAATTTTTWRFNGNR